MTETENNNGQEIPGSRQEKECQCNEESTCKASNSPADISDNQQEQLKTESQPQPKMEMPKMITLPEDEYRRLQAESNENKDKYLRSLAEAENARKRLQKEKQELVQYARENVVIDFLAPIDQMENALKIAGNMSDEVKNWAIGFNMILTHFKEALLNNGAQPFESIGKAFDPYRHEAVETIVTDTCPPGIIIEENIRGYSMGERVIRPARVKVSKAPTAPDADTEANSSATPTA